MIRFIDLSGQIEAREREFAFFDTLSGSFVLFSGVSTWTSLEDFKDDYIAYANLLSKSNARSKSELSRFLERIPESFFSKNTEGPELQIKENGDVVPDFNWKDPQVLLDGKIIAVKSIKYDGKKINITDWPRIVKYDTGMCDTEEYVGMRVRYSADSPTTFFEKLRPLRRYSLEKVARGAWTYTVNGEEVQYWELGPNGEVLQLIPL